VVRKKFLTRTTKGALSCNRRRLKTEKKVEREISRRVLPPTGERGGPQRSGRDDYAPAHSMQIHL